MKETGRCRTYRVEYKTVFVVFLLQSSLSLFAVVSDAKEQETKPSTCRYEICKSPECFATAQRIKSSMNTSASPCDDFYEYACGGWMRSTVVPDDKKEWGSFSELTTQLTADCVSLLEDPKSVDPKNIIENTRAFYQKCVSTENATIEDANAALIDLLNEIGGIPFINSTVKNETFDWLEKVAFARKQLGMGLFMAFSVSFDKKNPNTYRIYLDQPSSFGLGRLILKDKDLEKNQKYIEAYKSYILSTICLLKNDVNCGDANTKNEIEKLIDFEAKIAQLAKDPALRRDPNALYVKMTISRLQQNVSNLPMAWEDYVNNILEETAQTVNGDTEIVVKEEEYIKKMIDLLNETDKKTVSNYVGWRILQEIGPYSSKEFRANEFQFKKVTTGIKKQTDVTDKCFDETNYYFGFAVNRLYVEKHFSKNAKAEMEEMTRKVFMAFRNLLDENSWMDRETKINAEEKLALITKKIAYPSWVEDLTEVDDYYKHYRLAFVKDAHFIKTYSNILHAATLHEIQKLNQTPNWTKEWVGTPTVVNAYYATWSNTITFAPGILQPPFYQYNTLHSINYGGIGYIIGHEITHGFDDQGSEYNGAGQLKSWWSKNTRQKFNERKQCFVKQYSNVEVQLSNETLNLKGNQTIGENIADNGGIREAFRAYQLAGEGDIRLPGLNDIDHKKLFFLSAANIWCTKYQEESLKDQINNGVHSPSQYRATIPLSNTEEFAKVFQCKKGTNMNPIKKCVLW